MSKVTVLPYKSPYCSVCGKPLPKGRSRKCYACQPQRGNHHKPAPGPALDQPYTLNDRVAQADAYGLSYGNFMAIIENGWKLPPLRHPIRWPEGSKHAGE